MRKINLLTQSVYNRIAAGEVVDRPYSAAKELIENSLDAKATEIEIHIEKGGKQLIKVADNGTGIERDDLKSAFLPHATSKIATVDDLNAIETLGFRGEALASISSISKVKIVSVTEGNTAYSITCDGGKTGEIEPAALEKGTVISVNNLFYNTPVRAKFLKADKKEESDITNFVARYILGNPEVCFKYFADGKLVLQSYGGGLDEAVAQVYGAKVLSQCFKINAEKDGVKIHGFIGNQNFFKPNKTYQSLFLNGRYIINNTVSTAILQAYSSYMMKRQFPFYVLNIEVPSHIVDVNVHPNKADVRFVDNKFIFSAVYSVISSVLDGTSRAADFVIDEKRLPEIRSGMAEKENSAKVYADFPEKAENEVLSYLKKYEKSEVEKDIEASGIKTEPVNREINVTTVKKSYFDPAEDLPLSSFMPKSDSQKMSVTDDIMPPDIISNLAAYTVDNSVFEKSRGEQQKIDLKSFKFKGSLFDTYLIYEGGDCVYLIDQHAAHERLIYDSLHEKLAKREIARQTLLVPYIFSTNTFETRFLESKSPVLRAMGFGISPFGLDSFRIDEVPVDLQDINIKEFFDDVLADIDGLKDIKLEEILKDKIAMTACKHAVKGGMRLTDGEVDALFKMVDGNMGLKCPHGRPVCVTLSKKDIEKMFKRIV